MVQLVIVSGFGQSNLSTLLVKYLVNGSIRLLVQFLVSPNMEPLSESDCTVFNFENIPIGGVGGGAVDDEFTNWGAGSGSHFQSAVS